MRVLRGKHARNCLLIRQGGKCALCGEELKKGWHADHVVPWGVAKETVLYGMQATCAACNIKKGTRMLRSHQQKMLDLFRQDPAILRRRKQVVASVYPGGGKSLLPIIAASALFRRGLIKKVCVVVPRCNLRRQIAEEFLKPQFRDMLGHSLTVMEACNEYGPAKGTDGWVTTYAAVSCDASRTNLAAMQAEPCLLFLDEVHHAAEGSAFHKALQPLYDAAAFRVLVTGCLELNGRERIAFLDYSRPEPDGNLYAEADITYGLPDALRDQAVIPIEFHHLDGKVNYIDGDGQEVRIGTLTMGREADMRKAIYAALRTDYADELLAKCVRDFVRHHRARPRSQMIVICSDIKQAGEVVKKVRAMGLTAALATSKEEDAQQVIQGFRGSVNPPQCLVTVAMAYEGLDAPRLTHLACLTHIRSWPWLMQALNRVTRFDPGAGPYREQHAHVYCMDDGLMAEAIRRIKDGQGDGIRDEDAEGADEAATPGVGGAAPQSDAAADAVAAVVPLSGAATYHRVSGMGVEGELSHQEAEYLQDVMNQWGLSGSVLAFNSAIKAIGIDVAAVATTRPVDEPTLRPLTPKEQEKKLRDGINRIMNRLDRMTNSDPGTWNKRCYEDAQHFRARDELTLNELLQVWKWANANARRMGLEGVE